MSEENYRNLSAQLTDLRRDMDARLEKMDWRIDSMDKRLGIMEAKIYRLSGRLHRFLFLYQQLRWRLSAHAQW